jgi:carbonic anhydrase/acetyltransferase-like protein (isoleucine patch superfamily)
MHQSFSSYDRKDAVIGDLTQVGMNATVNIGVKVGQECLIGNGATIKIISQTEHDTLVLFGPPTSLINSTHPEKPNV